MLAGPVTQQRVRDLNQAAGPVADQGISPDRASVVQIEQNLQPATNDVMRFAAFDIGHKTHSARIMFVTRVVETLAFRTPHTGKPSDYPLGRSTPAPHTCWV